MIKQKEPASPKTLPVLAVTPFRIFCLADYLRATRRR